MIGEILDGWKLIKKLGEGGTGETYLAGREGTGEQAAAKVLFPQASADRALLDKLFADTRAASQVNHVGMVEVLACGVHGSGRAYLVMELLEGKTLTDALIDLGAVTDIESFADIAWQLATLLGAAHAAKLMHGALRPDGIFLTFPPAQAPRPLVKVLDFGMAKFSTSVRHSQTGSLLGAPLYMSPELGRGLSNVDHRADVYSLGCILFEMLCGRPPFVREGAGELIVAHTTETPPSVSSLEPAVAPGIDNLIGRMLTKNPAVRPQSMAEVAGVLEKFFQCPAPGVGAAMAAPPALPDPGLQAPLVPPHSSPVFPAGVPVSATVDIGPSIPAAVMPARRPDPTALLPPEDLVAQVGMAAGPSAPQTWVARVHQRTTILEPSLRRRDLPQAPGGRPPGSSRGAPAKTTRRRPSGAVAPTPGTRLGSGLNLPVVIATASIVLAIGAALLLLRARKPAAPAPPPPASSQRAPVRAEPFEPPPETLLSPAIVPGQPPHQAEPGSSVPPRQPRPSAASPPEPGSQTKTAPRKPARRW